MPRIPLIEDLTTGSIPPGTILLVEFTGASQWYNASFTIAAAWLKEDGKVSYNSIAHSPDDVRSKLIRLGVNSQELENEDKLWIVDFYTTTLGQKSTEKYARDSLKAADLSIRYSREVMRQPLQPDWLRLGDNLSTLARFNDEKTWVEFALTRIFPSITMRKSTSIIGIMRGIHGSWAYEQLEAAADGIVDFKLEEADGGVTRDLMRIRTMRNVAFTRGWQPLKVNENFEVAIEK